MQIPNGTGEHFRSYKQFRQLSATAPIIKKYLDADGRSLMEEAFFCSNRKKGLMMSFGITVL